jgi:D-beta-D-heptose 7-phosphate kinase/D-beta-D-heptose 1-phosphate adenosyltransferase
MTRDKIREILQKVKGRRILVIGDVMVDEYIWGRIDRISPEAPIQVVDVQTEDALMGGAANVVANLTGLGAKVSIAGVVGNDQKGRYLKQRLKEEGARIQGLLTDPKRPTSTKTRIMGQNQQLLRIDHERRTPLSQNVEARLVQYVHKQIAVSDAVVLSDYGKGVMTKRLLSEAVHAAGRAGIYVMADPKGKDFTRYRGVTCITPNRIEAEESWGRPIRSTQEARDASRWLQKTLKSRACLMTLGKDGMALMDRKAFTMIPTVAREVYDVSGAGDTVIAVFALVASAGYDLKTAAMMANTAAGIVVGKVGAARATPQEILDYDRGPQDTSQRKVLMPQELQNKLRSLQKEGKTVVFTNGCFDLLHVGHIRYLQESRRLGDCLVIGLNSDASVRRLKGKQRPLISQEERAHILSALDCVDYLVIFNELTPLNLIRRLKPDVLVKGGDYKKSEVVGADRVEEYGGRVELIPIVKGRSTSDLVQRIVERYGNNS